MDSQDTPEQRAFRDTARRWLRDAVAEVCGDVTAADYEWRREEYPLRRRWQAELARAGWAGLAWPVEYGGRSLPMAHQAIFHQEAARARAPRPINSIGLYMAGPTIIAYGTDAQKAEHLAAILSGEMIWCQGFSEPGAGSDLSRISLVARPVDGGYRVTGTKIWTSYAEIAQRCLLLTRGESTGSGRPSMTMLVARMEAPGITVNPIRQATGSSGFNEVVFDDVFIPDADVLGPIGQGWRVAMTTLAHERATMGFALQADCAGLLIRLVNLVKTLGREGDDVIATEIGHLSAQVNAMEALGRIGLLSYEDGSQPGPEGSLIKLTWEDLQQQMSRFAVELLGGLDVGVDDVTRRAWERTYLRSRGNTIEAGTTEMHLNAISQRLLGMPRPARS